MSNSIVIRAPSQPTVNVRGVNGHLAVTKPPNKKSCIMFDTPEKNMYPEVEGRNSDEIKNSWNAIVANTRSNRENARFGAPPRRALHVVRDVVDTGSDGIIPCFMSYLDGFVTDLDQIKLTRRSMFVRILQA